MNSGTSVEGGERRSISVLLWALSIVAGALMLAMMALTFVDVLGRYLVARPIPGASDVIGFILGTMIFSALPIVSYRDGHITVSLFDRLFRGAARRVQQVFVSAFSTAAVGFMAFRLFEAADYMRLNDQLADYLDIAVAPFVFAMAVLAGIACVMLVLVTYELIVQGDAKHASRRSESSF